MRLKYKIAHSLKFLKYILPKKYLKSIINKANNNRIVIVKQDGTRKIVAGIDKLFLNFSGHNNTIEFHEPFRINRQIKLTLLNNSKIIFNKNSSVSTIIGNISSNSNFIIGEDFTCGNMVVRMGSHPNGSNIIIGNDCMFSIDLIIRTSDGHAIYSVKDKKVINLAKDIKIGNHVWICQRAMLLKGAEIPDNSIVGANTIVTKKFNEPNCILAGCPARVVKRGINWDRREPAIVNEIFED